MLGVLLMEVRAELEQANAALKRGRPKSDLHQLSMVEQVREAMEKANQKVYGGRVTVH